MDCSLQTSSSRVLCTPSNHICGIHDVPQLLLQDIFSHLNSVERFVAIRVCKRWNYVVDMPAAFHHMAFYIPVEADVTVKSQRRKKRKHDEEQECQKSVSIFNGKSIHQYNRALSTVAQRGKPHVRSLLFYGNFFPGSEVKGRLWENQDCTFDGCKIRGRLLKEFEYGEKEYSPLRQVTFVNCSIFIGELAGRWMIFERIKPEIILQNVVLREIVRFFAFYESFDRFAEIPVVITGKEKLDVSSFLKSKPELEEKFKKNIDSDYFDFNIHKEISKTVLQNDKNVCMLLMPLLEKYVPQLSSSEVLAWKDSLTKKRCLPRTLSSTFRDYLKLFVPTKYKKENRIDFKDIDFPQIKPLVWLMMEALIRTSLSRVFHNYE